MTIENAVITGTKMGFDREIFFTCWVYLKFHSGAVGYRGHIFCEPLRDMDLLDTVGVEKWEDLVGQHIRVDHEGWGGGVTRIGHIIEDKWFTYKLEEGE